MKNCWCKRVAAVLVTASVLFAAEQARGDGDTMEFPEKPAVFQKGIMHEVYTARSWLNGYNVNFWGNISIWTQGATRVEQGQDYFADWRFDINANWKPFDCTEFLVNMRGGSIIDQPFTATLSGNIGAAGLVNNSYPNYWIYLYRLWVRQHFFEKMVSVTVGYDNSWYYFDLSDIEQVESRRFMASVMDNDRATQLLGTAVSAHIAYNPADWLQLQAQVLNAEAGNPNDPFDHIDDFEPAVYYGFQLCPTFRIGGGKYKGTYRFHGWHSEKTGQEGDGVGIMFDQNLPHGLVPFLRFGYGEKGTAKYEYYASLGLGVKGRFNRADDLFGFAVMWGKVSTADPTRGPLINEAEVFLETFYRLLLTPVLEISPDVQAVISPAYSKRDVVFVFGGRASLRFD